MLAMSVAFDGFLGVLIGAIATGIAAISLVSAGECRAWGACAEGTTAKVIFDYFPSFLLCGGLSVLLASLSILTDESWRPVDFLFGLDGFCRRRLNHLVHLNHAVVVFVQATDLPGQQVLLLVLHGETRFE